MYTDFIPSMNGFHFPNSFADGPVIHLDIPLIGKIGVGNAGGGLCGGMAFAALDYWRVCRAIPSTKDVPEQENPLFRYIAGRLIDSFHIPMGVWQYIAWMTHSGSLETRQNEEGQRIMAASAPVTLGLVRQHSLNPADLAHCHQVLAYRAASVPGGLRVYIYDPNYPDRDDIYLATEGGPHATAEVSHSEDGRIHGFFTTHYSFKTPPELF